VSYEGFSDDPKSPADYCGAVYSRISLAHTFKSLITAQRVTQAENLTLGVNEY
jgi:hypothetical protein